MSYRAGNLSPNDHLSFLVYFVQCTQQILNNDDDEWGPGLMFLCFQFFFFFFFFFYHFDLYVCVCAELLSCVWPFATPWSVAHKAPLSMELSRQECWSGLPFSTSGDLPDPGIECGSPALQADCLQSRENSPAISGFPDFWKPDSFSLEFIWWVGIQ